MANPGSIIGQISEEFGEIGKRVVTEAVKAPKDIAGKALESLGTASPKLQKSSPQPTKSNEATARAALEEIARRRPKSKEPSVRERIEMEEKQKKEAEAKKQEQVTKMELKPTPSKPKRGNLFHVGIEKNRNVRQD